MDEATKALIRPYYDEVWTAGNAAVQETLLADDYVDHDPTPGFGNDKAAIQLVAAMTATMKDVEFDLQDLIVDGDRAAAHWRMSWTQIGNFFGGVPADGKRLQLHGHDFYRIKNGQIGEIWHCEDFLGVMAQLGVLPAPA